MSTGTQAGGGCRTRVLCVCVPFACVNVYTLLHAGVDVNIKCVMDIIILCKLFNREKTQMKGKCVTQDNTFIIVHQVNRI